MRQVKPQPSLAAVIRRAAPDSGTTRGRRGRWSLKNRAYQSNNPADGSRADISHIASPTVVRGVKRRCSRELSGEYSGTLLALGTRAAAHADP
jgi:hypothetical protein